MFVIRKAKKVTAETLIRQELKFFETVSIFVKAADLLSNKLLNRKETLIVKKEIKIFNRSTPIKRRNNPSIDSKDSNFSENRKWFLKSQGQYFQPINHPKIIDLRVNSTQSHFKVIKSKQQAITKIIKY